jgi:hypothetical protein
MEEIYNQINIHKEKINELTNRLKNSNNITEDIIKKKRRNYNIKYIN